MTRRQISQNEPIQTYVSKTNAWGEVANAFGSMSQLAGTYADIKNKKDETKMNDYLADANIEAMNATQKWKIENELDPLNPEKLKGLDREYDKIFDKYTNKVSMVSRGDWLGAKQKVKNKYNQSTAAWGVSKVVSNAESALNSGMDKANKGAYLLGMQGDWNMASQTYHEQKSALTMAATGIMPQTAITEAVDNFKSDYTKNYIQGLIKLNPDGAEDMLNNQQTLKDIDSADAVDLLEKMISRQRKQNDANTLMAQKKTEGEIADKLIADPESIELSDLQAMDLQNKIRPAFAKEATNFKTTKVFSEYSDPTAYNDITEMLTGARKKKDGTLYNTEEIGAEILNKSNKLTKADAGALSKSFADKRRGLRDKYQKVEVEMITQKLEEFDIDTTDIERVVVDFNKQVLEETADSKRIVEISRALMTAEIKKVDPTYVPPQKEVDPRTISKQQAGTIIVNPKTKERMVLNEAGRWVPIQ